MEVCRWDLYRYIREIKDSKIIIFGSDTRAEAIYRKFCLVDCKAAYFVDDIIEEQTLCGCAVRNYHDLLYENPNKIKVVIVDQENLEKCFRIGLCTKENLDNCLLLFKYNRLKNPLDPTIGYNTGGGNSEYPGFVLFGEKKAEYTIVTLGGSTTDAFYAAYAVNKQIKSWSELLSDKLKQEGIAARVLCGGVAGQKSSQELLKLIRDVVPIDPDMVISYDGFNEVNDLWQDHLFNGRFPFLNAFQKKLFPAIANLKKTGIPTEYTFGIDLKISSYINWKNAVNMMHLICEGYGIKYISVLQPSFYNQVDCLGEKSDREMLIHMGLKDRYCNEIKQFFAEKDNDEWHPDWLKDLRTIFQGIDNVYYDTCHVWEKGNKIIADYMFKFVKENLLSA